MSTPTASPRKRPRRSLHEVSEVTGDVGWTYASYDSATGEHKFVQGTENISFATPEHPNTGL